MKLKSAKVINDTGTISVTYKNKSNKIMSDGAAEDRGKLIFPLPYIIIEFAKRMGKERKYK